MEHEVVLALLDDLVRCDTCQKGLVEGYEGCQIAGRVFCVVNIHLWRFGAQGGRVNDPDAVIPYRRLAMIPISRFREAILRIVVGHHDRHGLDERLLPESDDFVP